MLVDNTLWKGRVIAAAARAGAGGASVGVGWASPVDNCAPPPLHETSPERRDRVLTLVRADRRGPRYRTVI